MADLTLEYAAGSYCIFPTSDSTSLLPSASFPGAGILEGLALGKQGRNSEGEQVRRALLSRAAPACEVSAARWGRGFVAYRVVWSTRAAEQSAWAKRGMGGAAEV